MRHLDGMAAAFWNLPDVVDALQNLAASRFGFALVGHAVGDEVDVAIGGVHGPEVVALVVPISELLELPGFDVHNPEIGGVTAAIVLAPPNHGMAIEGELAAILGIAAPVAPVRGHGMFQASV